MSLHDCATLPKILSQWNGARDYFAGLTEVGLLVSRGPRERAMREESLGSPCELRAAPQLKASKKIGTSVCKEMGLCQQLE